MRNYKWAVISRDVLVDVNEATFIESENPFIWAGRLHKDFWDLSTYESSRRMESLIALFLEKSSWAARAAFCKVTSAENEECFLFTIDRTFFNAESFESASMDWNGARFISCDLSVINQNDEEPLFWKMRDWRMGTPINFSPFYSWEESNELKKIIQ